MLPSHHLYQSINFAHHFKFNFFFAFNRSNLQQVFNILELIKTELISGAIQVASVVT